MNQQASDSQKPRAEQETEMSKPSPRASRRRFVGGPLSFTKRSCTVNPAIFDIRRVQNCGFDSLEE